MNSVNSKSVKSFTKQFMKGFLFAFFFFGQVKINAQEAEIAPPQTESRIVAPTQSMIARPSGPSVKQKNDELAQAIRRAVQPTEPTKEIVILNTEAGFVPKQVRVKKGEAYKVHVVNLNMREKNVSFLMDSFSQSHNTIFGVKKTFNIEPQVEGVYSYQCPETGVQGQLIVVKDAAIEKRGLASAADDY